MADELVTLIYDNETKTVLAVEDCMILTVTPEQGDELCDGTLDLESVPSVRGMNAAAALDLLDAAVGQ